MKKTNSYTGQIYIGLREKYDGQLHSLEEVYSLCQRFVNDIGFCVTVTPTQFIYKNGTEPGVIVGTINYPRYPSIKEELQNKTKKLARIFLVEFKQHRISVVFPEETIMLENVEEKDFVE